MCNSLYRDGYWGRFGFTLKEAGRAVDVVPFLRTGNGTVLALIRRGRMHGCVCVCGGLSEDTLNTHLSGPVSFRATATTARQSIVYRELGVMSGLGHRHAAGLLLGRATCRPYVPK